MRLLSRLVLIICIAVSNTVFAQGLILTNLEFELEIVPNKDKRIDSPYITKVKKVFRKKILADALPWSEYNNVLVYDTADWFNYNYSVTLFNPSAGKHKVRKYRNGKVENSNSVNSNRRFLYYELPKVEANAEIEEVNEYELHDVYFMPSLQLYYGVECTKVTAKITYPTNADITIRKQFFNDNLLVEEKVVGKNTVLTITNKAVIPREENDQGSGIDESYYLPEVYVKVNSYLDKDGKKVELFNSSNNLIKWYQQFLKKNYNYEADTLPKQLVDSIFLNARTNKEKIFAATNWVQKSIKYISTSEKLEGWIPQVPSKVCRQRFGDCKGMSNILHRLLNYANVPNSLALIGTRDVFLKPSDWPSASIFNHMIVIAFETKGGNPIVLDGTDSYFQPYEPLESLIGREALLVTEGYEGIVPIPIPTEKESEMVDSISGKLVGSNLELSVKRYFYGLSKSDFLYRNYRGRIEKEAKKKIEDSFTSNKTDAKIDILKIEANDRSSSPSIVTYKITIPNVANTFDSKVILKLWSALPPPNEFHTMDIKENQTVPLSIEHKTFTRQVYDIELPNNLVLSKPNLNFSATDPQNFTYSVQGTQVGNRIKATLTHSMVGLILQKSDFKQFMENYNQFKQHYLGSIVLKTK